MGNNESQQIGHFEAIEPVQIISFMNNPSQEQFTSKDATPVPLERIVSVGSGAGEVEWFIDEYVRLKDVHPNDFDCVSKEIPTGNQPQVMCVDPLVNQYTEFYKKPDYDSIENLLIEKPDLEGDCTLMLMWTYDQMRMKETDVLPYDTAAIKKLKPKRVVILYEEFGAGGSDELHAWIESCGGVQVPHKFHESLLTTRNHTPNDVPSGYVCSSFIRKHYGTHSVLHFDEKSFVLALFERATNETEANVVSEARPKRT